MKKEYKYFGAISFIFILSITSLAILLRKYALLTFQHFLETCQQILPTFFSSGVHFVGLALVILVSLVAVTFFVKTLFSFVKTQRKINNLLKYRLRVFPGELSQVLEKVKLHEDKVVLIDADSNNAFNYGFWSRKIVLSTGLVNRLNTKQLEAVVLHELYHLKNMHSLLISVSEIVSASMFFLPLVKEINSKMKVVFEKQADAYTEGVQGSRYHIRMASLKVPSSRLQFYPGFAVRRQYKMSGRSMLVSVFAVFILMSLLLFPVGTHATKTTTPIVGSECTESQCSTHCPSDNMSSNGPDMLSVLQTNLASMSIIY